MKSRTSHAFKGDNAVHRADNVPMLLHHRLPECAGRILPAWQQSRRQTPRPPSPHLSLIPPRRSPKRLRPPMPLTAQTTKQAVAEFLTRYLDDMAHGNDDFGFDSSNSTMYDGLLQLQGSFESHKNIALLRQWISFTQVLRETTVPAIDRGGFPKSLEITEFGIVDQLSGSGIMYEYLLKGYFKTTVMGAALSKRG